MPWPSPRPLEMSPGGRGTRWRGGPVLTGENVNTSYLEFQFFGAFTMRRYIFTERERNPLARRFRTDLMSEREIT